MKDELLARRCRALKLLLTDVDGVMTDGTVLLLPDGREAKSFHVRDGLGIVLAHAAGLKTGLVSGRSAEVVTERAQELRMAVVRQGVRDKAAALKDLPIMAEVGLTAAPRDAVFEVRTEAFMVLEAAGGQGCLREFIEAILKARGDWDRVTRVFGSTLP